LKDTCCRRALTSSSIKPGKIAEMPEPLVVYTSRYCAHSHGVEQFLKNNDIPARFINIDGDHEARDTLMSLNHGYASVPTVVFPDGTKLTEPSYRELRAKLGIEQSSLSDRIKRIFAT
jgi:mycoredoxin